MGDYGSSKIPSHHIGPLVRGRWLSHTTAEARSGEVRTNILVVVLISGVSESGLGIPMGPRVARRASLMALGDSRCLKAVDADSAVSDWIQSTRLRD